MMPGSKVQVVVLTSLLTEICPASWGGEAYKSSYWRLYYNNDRGAYISGGGAKLEMAERAPYIIPAGVVFDIRCNKRLDHLYIHFEVDGIPDSIMRRCFDRPFRVTEIDALAPLLERLRSSLASQVSSPSKSQCYANAAAYLAVGLALDGLDETDILVLEHTDPKLALIGPALHRIRECLSARLSISELAAECNMSNGYFQRLFRDAMGTTPVGYIKASRVRLAERLLLYSDKSIDDIAEECGFGTREYFSRVFHYIIGCSPVVYRNRRKA